MNPTTLQLPSPLLSGGDWKLGPGIAALAEGEDRLFRRKTGASSAAEGFPPFFRTTFFAEGSLPRLFRTTFFAEGSLPRLFRTTFFAEGSLPRLFRTTLFAEGSLPRLFRTTLFAEGSLPRLFRTTLFSEGSLPRLFRTTLFAEGSLLRLFRTTFFFAGSRAPQAMAVPNWDEGTWDDGGFWDTPTVTPPPIFPQKPKRTKYKTMASNPTPDDDDVLIALTEDLADGCHVHEVAIGIKHYTEAVMRAALLGANSALMGLGEAKVLRDEMNTALATQDAAGKAVLRDCRLRLLKVFGPTFNSSWQTAGFPNQSTAVPEDPDQRFTLLGTLKLYFTAHPSAESVDMDATAAICTAAHDALSNARQAANTAESNYTTAKDTTLPAAMKLLRKRVRGLINELGELIADDDSRWEAFGLNIPAQPSPPEAIADLTLTALGGGKVLLQWPYATRATNTRIMRKRIGVDEDFASTGTVTGLDKVLLGQTVGQTLEIYVVAYNDGGDAPASPTRSIVVT